VQLSARAQGFGGSRPPQTLWALPAPSVGRARRPHRPASHGRDGTVPQRHVHQLAPICVQLSARAQGFGGSRPPQTLWALPAPSVGRARRPHRPASHGRDGTVPQRHVNPERHSALALSPEAEMCQELLLVRRRSSTLVSTDEPAARCAPMPSRQGPASCRLRQRHVRPRRRSAPALAAEAEIRQKLLLVGRRGSTLVQPTGRQHDARR
jgi:hypothetical protein